MTIKKSPFDNVEPVPARTQETVFGVPSNGGANLNDALANIPSRAPYTRTPIESDSKGEIAVQERKILVPVGSDVIIYTKNFSPELITELDGLVTSLTALKPVAS